MGKNKKKRGKDPQVVKDHSISSRSTRRIMGRDIGPREGESKWQRRSATEKKKERIWPKR